MELTKTEHPDLSMKRMVVLPQFDLFSQDRIGFWIMVEFTK